MQSSNYFFNNIIIIFKNQQALYSSKYIYSLLFNLKHCIFQLATAATKEAQYIIIHPTISIITNLPSLKWERQKRPEKSSQSNALQFYYTYFLAKYIKQVFLFGELFKEGVEPLQTLDGPYLANIIFNKQTAF